MPSGEFHTFFVRQYPRLDENGALEFYDLMALDVESTRRAERADRHEQRLDLVGALSSGIAHDLNNHLTALLGNLAAAKKIGGSEVAPYVTAAERATFECAHMTKQLLSLSREERLEHEPLHPEQLVHDALDLVRHVIPKGIGISVKCVPEVSLVRGNRTQLHQVFVNLFLNARDAMAEDGHLSVHILEDSACTGIQILISDTGHGVPQEYVQKIFTPFFSTKTGKDGTGLGLSMVQTILQLHGGTIEVAATSSRGTTFRIRLPSIPQHRDAPTDAITSRRPITKILVAEDDDLVRSMLCEALRSRGYDVLMAKNGADAVSLFQHDGEGLDAVLLDENMPRMLGSQAASEILKIAPGARILIMSGYGAHVRPNLVGNGCVRFLGKPYNLQDLFLQLEEMTSRF
jgi:CheY-like chemotaxis protein